MATLTTEKRQFNIEQFITSLDPNYELEIHKLSGFVFNDSNIDRKHYVICIHNFLSSKASTFYQTQTRKLCESDLMRHGYRRHALYFNVNDKLNKRIYRYDKQDWPMNNGIPDLIQSELLNKIQNEFGIALNGVVYNDYASKKSQIWWHTDLQPGIGDIVCTFSTGRSERLEFRPMHKAVARGKERAKIVENKVKEAEQECVLSVDCHHGTLVIMTPGVNEYYQHRVSEPTETQLIEAREKYGRIDRENTTMHFHFDENKYDRYSNLDNEGGLAKILNYL